MRESIGLSQGDFAIMLDVSQAYLSRVENGKKPPSEKLLRRARAEVDLYQKQLAKGKYWDDAVAEERAAYGGNEAFDEALEMIGHCKREADRLSRGDRELGQEIFERLLASYMAGKAPPGDRPRRAPPEEPGLRDRNRPLG